QKKLTDAFQILHDKLHDWNPDLVIVIGDDQQENFLPQNLPTFCFYTGSELVGHPFHGPGAKINLWEAPQDTRYEFKAPEHFAKDLVAFLVRDGFDMSSATELKEHKWGLPHAHVNPMMFLNQDGAIPVLPLFVNCIGEDAGNGYTPRPTAKRCYELGQGIRRFLDTRDERVAIIASSSWSHFFLTDKFNRCAFDVEFDRKNLEILKQGNTSKLAELTPTEIQESGDHEFLNWIIALGAIGEKPAEIVEVLDEQSQVSFKVFALWE
ncbi:MAG: hypothetical protein ACE5Q6_05830, partial [Dehalococcoidia bacterium]